MSGAICALLIGSGIATGQEALQFFVSHAWWGFGGILIATAVFAWSISVLVEWGRANPGRSADIFVAFCGRYLGTALKYFVIVLLFAIVVTMTSGAGALLNEAYGVPVYVGSGLLATLIAVTLLLGLLRLVKIIGSVGPVLIFALLGIALIALAMSWQEVPNVAAMVDEHSPAKAVDSWILSALLWVSFSMLAGAPFFASVGHTGANRRASLIGSVLGSSAFGVVMVLMTLALLTNVDLVHDRATPMATLGSLLTPLVGTTFAALVFLGVYSTAAPMIWVVVDHFSLRSRGPHVLLVVVLCVAALIGGATLPFDTLVGTVFPFAGAVGLLFLGSVVLRVVRDRTGSRRAHSPAADDQARVRADQ